ncbi:gamma carbonic anhydrase family protein [Micavibrio aeruginosavorus]|uniref:Hexapeptide transferase family protein n=1 Tax=Micavibrio aeruginosavorus (strain ARL-13) TaxID=856793 RepID=G2KLY0_MICAA|nr:gamma carbonic anhydrase family protein [Micavibrio aeruginosavorus]AEP09359.1 hexapeptide transferase family protein [Micavibrio aeruginosavorus ARL-13]
MFTRVFKGKLPQIDASAFVAETAAIIGDVVVGAGASIWYGCTLRGDVNNIVIGARTNIQDGTIIHVSSTTQGTYVGDDVTVGHGAILHACTIGDRAFIGMQACVMDDATVEADAMVAAGALVTPGKTVPSGQLWGGRPARYMRDLTDDEKKFLLFSAERYAKLAQTYRAEPGAME